jgi:hypothetical protein
LAERSPNRGPIALICVDFRPSRLGILHEADASAARRCAGFTLEEQMPQIVQAPAEHKPPAGKLHHFPDPNAILWCVAVVRTFFARRLGIKRTMCTLHERMRQQLKARGAKLKMPTTDLDNIVRFQGNRRLPYFPVPVLAVNIDERRQRL